MNDKVVGTPINIMWRRYLLYISKHMVFSSQQSSLDVTQQASEIKS